MVDGVGDRFQQGTKYEVGRGLEGEPDRGPRTELYKAYPGAVTVELPLPVPAPGFQLDEAFRTRKSIRRYSEEPMTIHELSYLLWAANGVQREERGRQFRTVPSAGAQYPIENYIVVNRVTDLAPGIYHYAVDRQALELLAEGDHSEAVASAAFDQSMCAAAAVVFVWAAVIQRCRWRYGQRAYRYIYLDAGHIGQNAALAAVSLGLGSCQIAAFFDDRMSELVGVDGVEEAVVYMTSVGHHVRND